VALNFFITINFLARYSDSRHGLMRMFCWRVRNWSDSPRRIVNQH